MKTILVTCKNEDCNRTFRVPEYKWNSPIKNNPDKQECLICKNSKLLAKSTLYSSKKVKKTNIGFKTYQSASKTKTVKKRAKSAKSKAMANADTWFSRYIRIKYSYKIQNGDVFCQCIIEPSVIKHAKNMDNGHCFSRAFKATRYEEDNCRPQNRSSNRFSGEADHYTFIDNLTEQIGLNRFNSLDKLRRKEGEDNERFYLEQSDKFRILTNKLIKEREIIKWW